MRTRVVPMKVKEATISLGNKKNAFIGQIIGSRFLKYPAVSFIFQGWVTV